MLVYYTDWEVSDEAGDVTFNLAKGLETVESPPVVGSVTVPATELYGVQAGVNYRFKVTVIPWNIAMMEDWNNDKRPTPMFCKPGNMQHKIGAPPDAENVNIIFASASNIP